jgi:hypothetical protein
VAQPWFRYKLGRDLTEFEVKDLRALAGPIYLVHPKTIVAHLNVAWLVERWLVAAQIGVRGVVKPKLHSKLDMFPTVPGLREWVPAFMAPFQREFILAFGNAEAAFGILGTGAGKTVMGVVWSLLRPGLIVYITRAAARRTVRSEIERFTEFSPVLIEGQSAVAIPRDARFVIVGYESLIHHAQAIIDAKPATVLLDESHLASSHRRYATVVNVQESGEAVRENGGVKIDYVKLKNRFAALEDITRCQSVERRAAFTATPIRDRVKNLWAQLDLVNPRGWGFFYDWARRYADAHESVWGGIDVNGRGNDTALAELQDRVSFVVYYVPQSVTHRDLPPLRRQVTYIPQDELAAGKDVLREARDVASDSVWAALAVAAAMKRPRTVEEAVSGAYRAPDGRSGGKVVVFTGLRIDCEKTAAAISKAAAKGAKKDAVPLKVWYAHGGMQPKERDVIREEYMAHPGPCVLVATGDSMGECMRPDTLVLGENKQIIDYEAGDRVVGATGLVTCRGMKTKQHDGALIEVRAQGLLPFAATPNHPVLVMQGAITSGRDRRFVFRGEPTWKRIEHVEVWNPSPSSPKNAHGNFVLVPRVPGKFTGVTFDLTQHVLRPSDAAGRRTRGLPDTITLDADVAWLLGLYAAEGSAWRDAPPSGNESWRAAISLGSHERHVAERVVSVLAQRGIRAFIRPLTRSALNAEIRSTPLARLLATLMGCGAHAKRVPDEVLFNTDLDLVRAFVQGYAMGDGHTDGNKVQTYSVSKTLTLQMQLAVARLGRFAGITPWRPKPSQIRGRHVQGGPGFILTWRWKNMRHERFKVLDRYIAVPVKEIREVTYTGPVVDIGTTDFTFLASNAVVHNSVNLHDTDLYIDAMLPWTPGQVRQREGRFKRLGMKRPCLALYLVAEGTKDEHVAQMLLSKLPAVDAIAKDEVLKSFGDDLRGDEEEIANALLAKLTESEDEDDDHEN